MQRCTRRAALVVAAVATALPAAACARSISALLPSEADEAEGGPRAPDLRPQLSDEELSSILAAPIGPADYEKPAKIIGYRGPTALRLRVLCGDVCPHESVRVIDLVVDASQCERAGGAVVSALKPDIYPRCNATCVPKGLVDRTRRCEFASDEEGAPPVRVLGGEARYPDVSPAVALGWGNDAGVVRSGAASKTDAATSLLRQRAARLGIGDPMVGLDLVGETRDHAGLACVIFQQTVGHVPVFGSLVTVHFAPSGEMAILSGYEADAERVPTSFAVGPDEATARTRRDLSARYPRDPPPLQSSPQLYVVSARWRAVMSPRKTADGSPGTLVWRVPVTFASPAGGIPADWVIDASNGEILAAQYSWFSFDATGAARVP